MTKKQRLISLFAVFVMSFSVGTNVAWSIFAQELRAKYGFTMASSTLPFAVFQIAFALTFIIGGKFYDKEGPKKVAIIGGLLLGLGYFLAGLFEPSALIITLFAGVIGGTGAGLVYICPIGTAQKCFPEKKSFATGIAVAGLGVGALIISLTAEKLLRSGWLITDVFKVYGIIYAVLICSMTFFVKTPADCKKEETKHLPLKEILKDRRFWRLFIPMTVGIYAGLMIIGNLKTMGLSFGVIEFYAALGVSVMAITNTLGRIIWGWFAGKIGEEKAIFSSLFIQAAVILLSAFFINSTWRYILFSALVGLNYGACLVLYASFVPKVFGEERLGQIYPLLFFNNVTGIIAATSAGFIFDRTGTYTIALVIAGVLCAGGAVVFKVLGKK